MPAGEKKVKQDRSETELQSIAGPCAQVLQCVCCDVCLCVCAVCCCVVVLCDVSRWPLQCLLPSLQPCPEVLVVSTTMLHVSVSCCV